MIATFVHNHESIFIIHNIFVKQSIILRRIAMFLKKNGNGLNCSAMLQYFQMCYAGKCIHKKENRKVKKDMKLKKMIALLLVVVLSLSCLAGCGAEDEQLEFYFVSLMSGGAAWSRAEQGFLDACEELGVAGQYLAPVERNNMVEIANLIDQCITQEADAVIGVLASIEMFGPSLLKGKEQGTVLGSVQLQLPTEYVDFNIGTDQLAQGTKFGEALAELAGDKEYQVIWMCGSASEQGNMQYEGFVKALEAYPNITCLGMRFDEGSAATANQILTDELTANPGLNAVVCLDSSAATIGTASFVDEKGLEDEWLTIGIDASADPAGRSPGHGMFFSGAP